MAEDAQEGQGGGQERIAEGGQDKVNGCQSRVVFPSTTSALYLHTTRRINWDVFFHLFVGSTTVNTI